MMPHLKSVTPLGLPKNEEMLLNGNVAPSYFRRPERTARGDRNAIGQSYNTSRAFMSTEKVGNLLSMLAKPNKKMDDEPVSVRFQRPN